jgi:hypothetical protein
VMTIGKKDAANLFKCADLAESRVVELSSLLADPKSAGQIWSFSLSARLGPLQATITRSSWGWIGSSSTWAWVTRG